MKYFLLSVLAYYVFYYIIVPMLGEPKQPQAKPPRSTQEGYREEDSIRYYREENRNKNNSKKDEFTDYEEIK